MAFLNNEGTEYLIKKLSDSNNIKISGNKYGDRVSTVMGKLVEKADNITRSVEQEITNECYTFRVGTGNVDVSSDVEDGFGEIGLKGKTYQNVFGGINVNDNAREVITISQDRITWNKPSVTGYQPSIGFHKSLIELNKVYTLIFFIYENTLIRENAETDNVAKFNIVSYNSGCYFIKTSAKGLVKVKLEQPSVSTGPNPYLEVFNDAVGKLEISFPVLLEGDYSNDDNTPIEYFEGIVGVGDKSKNLLNLNTDNLINATIVGTADGSFKTSTTRVSTINGIKVDNKTDVYIKRYRDDIKIAIRYYLNGELVNKSYNGNGSFIPDKNIRLEGDAGEEYDEIKFIFAKANDSDISINEVSKLKIQVEKENQNIEEYTPYGKSILEVTSCGKNLWDFKNKNESGYIEYNTGDLVPPDCHNRTSPYIRIKPGIDYTYMTTVNVFSENHPCSWNAVAWYDKNKNYITRSVETGEKMGIDTVILTLMSPTNAAYVRVGSRYLEDDVAQVTFCEGVTNEHIPYVEDKIQIVLDEPLMRLPNGVYDEITKDGKLIRRVGKIVLDGEEIWGSWVQYESDTHISFYCNVSSSFGLPFYPEIAFGSVDVNGSLCSNLAWNDTILSKNSTSVGYLVRNASPNYVGIRHKKSTLGITSDMSEGEKTNKLAQWLQNNPAIIYYQLPNPIITDIIPPSLRIFKNGNITFNTLVAPESTHTVQLNKSAQIESCIRQVGSLNKRVDNMETLYDELLLETSRNIDLLCLDYNLETGWE